MTTTTFTVCTGCPSPISCDIRSACDRAPKERTNDDLLAEITGLKVRQVLLQNELAHANGCLAASREEARQMRLGMDRMAAAHEYETTKRFHEQAPAISVLVADLEVTAEEDEAFNALALRIDRLENAFTLQQGRIATAHDRLDALRAAV